MVAGKKGLQDSKYCRTLFEELCEVWRGSAEERRTNRKVSSDCSRVFSDQLRDDPIPNTDCRICERNITESVVYSAAVRRESIHSRNRFV